MKKLPTVDSPGEFLSNKENRKVDKGKYEGQYYDVTVDYDYNIVINEGVTYQEAKEEYEKNRAGTGIVLTPDEGTTGEYAKDAREKLKSGISPESSSFGYYNYIFLSPLYYGSNPTHKFGGYYTDDKEPLKREYETANSTEVVVHGAGHNSAKLHKHKTGIYEYYQRGLQSNERGQVYPTQQNTGTIINDPGNRKTLKK